MAWIKRGCVFSNEPFADYSSHCQVPTPYVLSDRIRIFYANRKKGKAFITYFDLDFDLKTILFSTLEPILSHGAPGMFDADGVMPSCVIENDGELWMYYIGWSELKNTARYQNEIGLAVSRDGGESFSRLYRGPVVGRSPYEPGLAVMPFVMRDGDGDGELLRMWYQSGTGWSEVEGRYEPTYLIKYAASVLGVEWRRHSLPCIAPKHDGEAFSRPWVLRRGEFYHMYFCYRDSEDYRGGKGSYRIGYAESDEGLNFLRMDFAAGIKLGKEGEFDSEMQCYPAIATVNGKEILFYNGNLFGQTGIGLAVWN